MFIDALGELASADSVMAVSAAAVPVFAVAPVGALASAALLLGPEASVADEESVKDLSGALCDELRMPLR